MAELVVLDFDGTETADAVLVKLRDPGREHLIDLLDNGVVIHPEGGEVQIGQSVNLTALGASQGMTTRALLGGLAGLLVLNPLAGFAPGGAVGAAMGALGGRMADFGINPGFIKELDQMIKPVWKHRPARQL